MKKQILIIGAIFVLLFIVCCSFPVSSVEVTETTIYTDQDKYYQGETITITLRSFADINNMAEVQRFHCYINYQEYDPYTGWDDVELAQTLYDVEKNGAMYTAEYSFDVSDYIKWYSNVFISAYAVSSNGDIGETGGKTIYVYGDEHPGETKLSTYIVDQSECVPGATIRITLQSEKNHYKKNDIIDHFDCYVRYYPGTSGIGDYIFNGDIAAEKVSGQEYLYRGVYEFEIPKCEEIHIYGCAISSDGYGCRESGEEILSVTTLEETLIVYVTDEDSFPLSNVKVVVGSVTKYTDTSGIASFSIENGMYYQIEVSKSNYVTQNRQNVYINQDTSLQFSLVREISTDENGSGTNTPGFEFIIAIFTILFVLILKKHTRR